MFHVVYQQQDDEERRRNRLYPREGDLRRQEEQRLQPFHRLQGRMSSIFQTQVEIFGTLCHKKIRGGGYEKAEESVETSTYYGGADACQGDSGGPLEVSITVHEMKILFHIDKDMNFFNPSRWVWTYLKDENGTQLKNMSKKQKTELTIQASSFKANIISFR